MIIGIATLEVLEKETSVGTLSPLIFSLLLPQQLGKSITFALLKQGQGGGGFAETQRPQLPQEAFLLPYQM